MVLPLPHAPILPDRHPQTDLFVCDIVDAVPKGDMASMEHPVFSLSTKPDMKPRKYQSGDNFIEVSPSRYGLATVHDRDILIYCISQCMAAINEGRTVHKKIRFKAHDLLVATNRQTSGRGYELLKDAFRRLQGTQIETNIRQGGKEYFKVFGLIESAEIVKETRDGKMLDVEITLSDWVFDAIENNHVLTLNRRYFLLRKPLERKLYEVARKHCGNQPKWKISIEKLRDKCGSASTAKEFKRLLTKIINDNDIYKHMPDYSLAIRDDKVLFYNQKQAAPRIKTLEYKTFRKTRRLGISEEQIIDWEQEWRQWIQDKNISVKNPDSHFLSFCERKLAKETTNQTELF